MKRLFLVLVCMAGATLGMLAILAQRPVREGSAGDRLSAHETPAATLDLAPASGRATSATTATRTRERAGVNAEAAPSHPSPPDTSDVAGRVLFPPGTPVDEPVVVVVDRFGEVTEERIAVAADGTFQLTIGGARIRALDIDAPHLYLPRAVRWERSASAAVVLEPLLGGCILGRIVRLDERVSASGEIVLVETRTAAASTRRTKLLGELEFRFDGVPPGWYRIAFAGAAHLVDDEEFLVFAGATVHRDQLLSTGAFLAGRVLDESGAGVSGARLIAVEGARSTSAGPDGRFVLGGLPAAPLVLRVERSGYRTVEQRIEGLSDGESREDLEIRLTLASALEGRVIWPDGTPAQATLRWSQDGAGPTGERELRTDKDGRFRVVGLAEEGLVHLSAEGWLPRASSEPGPPLRAPEESGRCFAWVEDVSPEARDLLLVLRPTQTLAGRVVAPDGAPIPAFRVKIRRITLRRGRTVARDGSVHTLVAPDGRFELTDLAPGRWEVRVFADGFEPSGEIAVVLPATHELEIGLRPR